MAIANHKVPSHMSSFLTRDWRLCNYITATGILVESTFSAIIRTISIAMFSALALVLINQTLSSAPSAIADDKTCLYCCYFCILLLYRSVAIYLL